MLSVLIYSLDIRGLVVVCMETAMRILFQVSVLADLFLKPISMENGDVSVIVGNELSYVRTPWQLAGPNHAVATILGQ